MRRAVESLAKDSAFKGFLRKEAEIGTKFNGLKLKLAEIPEDLKKLRNDIGGNIEPGPLKDALSVYGRTSGLIQIGNSPKDTHFTFAVQTIMLMISRRLSRD